MEKSTIIWNENNIPISTYYDDVYFNTEGAIAETKYVFIEGNRLYERFIAHEKNIFIVGETGFGSGLNLLLLWQTFLEFKRHYPDHILEGIKFLSVEKHPLSLNEIKKMHEKVIPKENELYSLAKQLHAQLYENNNVLNNIDLTILYDDICCFPDFLAQQNLLVDAWFFDGFSPAKNPDMWSQSLFKPCYQFTALKGTFATFTSAGFVRRNLQAAGFNVYKRKGFGIKREMLTGCKNEITLPN